MSRNQLCPTMEEDVIHSGPWTYPQQDIIEAGGLVVKRANIIDSGMLFLGFAGVAGIIAGAVTGILPIALAGLGPLSLAVVDGVEKKRRLNGKAKERAE